MSFLSTIGKDFKAVFSWLGSSKGQTTIAAVEATATGVVTAINPGAGLALAGVEALINTALKEVISIESVSAAAEQQTGSGAQKLAATLEAAAPQASAFLQSIGVPAPTAVQIQAVATIISQGMVNIVNALPANATEAAALTVPARTPAVA